LLFKLNYREKQAVRPQGSKDVMRENARKKLPIDGCEMRRREGE